MDFPDCAGQSLEKAEKLLKEKGFAFETEEIRPFFKGKPEEPAPGELRVVKQELSDDGKTLRLYVCSLPYGEDAR